MYAHTQTHTQSKQEFLICVWNLSGMLMVLFLDLVSLCACSLSNPSLTHVSTIPPLRAPIPNKAGDTCSFLFYYLPLMSFYSLFPVLSLHCRVRGKWMLIAFRKSALLPTLVYNFSDIKLHHKVTWRRKG